MGAFEQAIERIGDPMVRELAQRGQIRSFAKNAVILQEGERGDSMFVILGVGKRTHVGMPTTRATEKDNVHRSPPFGLNLVRQLVTTRVRNSSSQCCSLAGSMVWLSSLADLHSRDTTLPLLQ